jgi:hypothetical protein
MADPVIPPRPDFKRDFAPSGTRPDYNKDYAPNPNSPKYKRDKRGTLTTEGRALFQQDETEAKARHQADAKAYDDAVREATSRYNKAADAWDNSYGKGLAAQGTQSEEAAKYLSGPEHRWYQDNTQTRGLEALAGSTVANTLLGFVPGMRAYPGITRSGRALLATPYAAELGYNAWNAYDQNPDPKDPHSVDIANYNRALDAGWGAGSLFGGLKSVTAYPGGAGTPKNALVAGPTPEVLQQAIDEALNRRSPPSNTPEPAPLSEGGQKLVNGARLLGLETNDPKAARAHIENSLAEGRVSPADRIELRKALAMTSPQHTFTNALKKITPALALTAGGLALLGGRDEAEASPYYDPTSEMYGGSPPYTPPDNRDFGQRWNAGVNALGRAAPGVAEGVASAVAPFAMTALDIANSPSNARAQEWNANPAMSQREAIERDFAANNLRRAQEENARQVHELMARRQAEQRQAQLEVSLRREPAVTPRP